MVRYGLIKSGGDSEDSTAGGADDSALGEEHYPVLETALGYKFKDYNNLVRALTHRSVHRKGGAAGSDYERLEFLGDAVLDLAVANLLLLHHQAAKEGELSKMRAALVNTATLAELAGGLQLSRYIILSRGEFAHGGAERPSILADVVEAIIGAIFKESGFDAVYAVIEKLYGSDIRTVTPRDPKTELQEVLHAAGEEAPLYLLESAEGPEHAPTFNTVVEVEGKVLGRGKGTTKKASQQRAAAEALRNLQSGNIQTTGEGQKADQEGQE